MSASALAANNGLTPEAYQSKWMSEYSGQSVSGPRNKYRSTMDGVSPSSAGADTTVRGEQVAEEQQASSSTQSLTKQLAELNQTSRELLAVNKKILARQS